MEVTTGYSLWILLILLLISSFVWLWTALRRHRKNQEDGIQLQKRLHRSIGDPDSTKPANDNHQLAERLKQLTDEANDLLHRLVEKHESAPDHSDEDLPPKE